MYKLVRIWMAAPRTQSVPALERALLILECLAQSQHGLTLSQIARALKLPKSTVHCLLLTFERCGYIQRDDASGRYRLGLRLFRIVNSALPAPTIRDQAAAVLRELMESTRLTVHMAVLDDDEIVLIAKFAPPGLPTAPTWVGKRMEFHCTALGKALVAYLEESELEHLIRDHGMLRHNDNTISSVRRLRQDLEQVRCRGYSLDDEEEEIGSRCVGAPVLDASGRARAAISVVGTVDEIDGESLPRLVATVKEAASVIAGRLLAAESRGADIADAAAGSRGAA